MTLTMEQQAAVLLPYVRSHPNDEDSWKKLRGCVSKMRDMDGLEEDFKLLTEEFLKGRVDFASAPETGTTFSVELPTQYPNDQGR